MEGRILERSHSRNTTQISSPRRQNSPANPLNFLKTIIQIEAHTFFLFEFVSTCVTLCWHRQNRPKYPASVLRICVAMRNTGVGPTSFFVLVLFIRRKKIGFLENHSRIRTVPYGSTISTGTRRVWYINGHTKWPKSPFAIGKKSNAPTEAKGDTTIKLT